MAKPERPTQDLTLRDLADEACALDDLVYLEDGEWTPEIEALHDELSAKLFGKVDGYGTYLSLLKSREDAIDAERKRLKARQESFARQRERLANYAVMQIMRMGQKSIDGNFYTLRVQANPPTVQVDVLVDALPAEYIRVIPEEHHPDRRALLAALKGGAQIDGVSLAPTSYHLRIA